MDGLPVYGRGPEHALPFGAGLGMVTSASGNHCCTWAMCAHLPARRHPNAPRAGAAACTWCARWPDVPVTSPRWRGGLLQATALAREHVGCRRAGARLRAGGRAGARAVWRWPRWPGRGKMVKAGNFRTGAAAARFFGSCAHFQHVRIRWWCWEATAHLVFG